MYFSKTFGSLIPLNLIIITIHSCIFVVLLNFQFVNGEEKEIEAGGEVVFVDSDAEYRSKSTTMSQKIIQLQAMYNDLFEVNVNGTTMDSKRRPDLQSSGDSNFFLLPDLSHISTLCPKDGLFAYFNPSHMKAVKEVVDILYAFSSNTTNLMEVAQALKESRHINPHLWFYAISIVGIKHPDLQMIKKLQPYNAMPDLFVPTEVIDEAVSRRKQNKNKPDDRQNRNCIQLDEKFGSDNGVENRLWYFRENILLNSHHWYYHEMYPHFQSPTREDRRGELFYYLHASVLARYNAERLSNGLIRVQPMSIKQDSLLEPYNSHLKDMNSGERWSDRKNGTKLKNLNTRSFTINIENHLRTPLDRLNEAIQNGYAKHRNNQQVSLKGINGIDIFGDIMQCHYAYSVNTPYYNGDRGYGFHNSGHILVAYSSDPTGRNNIPGNVMADPVTSMRDPIFFQWHMTVHLIFDKYKKSLPPYQPTGGELQLLWPGVKISNIKLLSGEKENELETFWRIRNVDLSSRGIDLRARESELNLCIKELGHRPFSYQFTISKQPSVRTKRATVRIYIAPRFSAAGKRLSINVQRTFFFVLDVFGVELNQLTNRFVRYSNQSLLTIPLERAVENINEPENYQTPYCGCGWPENLLIPKGTKEGMQFDLFIMVTNGDDDFVEQTATPIRFWDSCIPRPIYCGIVNQKYPDAKPMGYPFDRWPYYVDGKIVKYLDDYINGITNMGTVQFQIKFKDEIHKDTNIYS